MRSSARKPSSSGRAGCALLLIAALLFPGCARKPEKEAFNEQWQAQANRSQGFSPVARPRKVEFEQTTIALKKDDRTAVKQEKPLPKQKVTLRMYDTDLTIVIRAMARAANQNVVLSSSITGGRDNKQAMLVNLNVVDAPWDETFKSLLTSNNLHYVVDGDIIRVMTVEDMEKQNKLKEANNKLTAEAVKAKELEPLVTCRVEVNYADLDELAVTLNALCGNTVSSSSTTDKTTDEKKKSEIEVSTPPKKENVSLPSKSDDKKGQLSDLVVPDRYSNSLVIRATRENAEKLVKLVEKLDQPRPQIRLKAFIVQTTREVAQQLGVQWGGLIKGTYFQMTPGTTSTTTTGTTATPIFGGAQTGLGWGVNNPASLTADPTGLASSGTALNFLFGKVGENMLEAQLTALATESKVKILSSPTITTMENKQAYTENGKKIPYVSTSQNGTNVQFADAMLRLEMTPHVVDGSNLRMHIVVKDDQVDSDQTNWVQGNPPIFKRETRSTLVVEDGDTIVISGLTRDTVTNSENGVPFLRNVPLLGWAFKSKGSDVKHEDILIFITPTILKEKPIAPVPGASEQASFESPIATMPEPQFGRP